MTGKNLVIRNNVDISRGVMISTFGGVHIGERTLVGYGTRILSSNHKIPNGEQRIFNSGTDSKPIFIANDCWIGAGCTILPGVTIGEGVVVAAGSVVTKDVKSFTIVAGVPAKIIRRR